MRIHHSTSPQATPRHPLRGMTMLSKMRTVCCLLLLLAGTCVLHAQVEYTTKNMQGKRPGPGHQVTLDLSYPVFEGNSPCAVTLNEWISKKVKLIKESSQVRPRGGGNRRHTHDDETYELFVDVTFQNQNLIVLEATSSHQLAHPDHGGESYTQTFAYDLTRDTWWDCRMLVESSKLPDLVKLMTSRLRHPDHRYDPADDPYAYEWQFGTDGYHLVGFTEVFLCMDETISERVTLPFSEITEYLNPPAMRLIGR